MNNLLVPECCICLEFLLGEICILSCGHQYHFDCMTKWINHNNVVAIEMCTKFRV